jgi:hypothetical protein
VQLFWVVKLSYIAQMTNRQDTGHPDSDEINFRERDELEYWAFKWKVSIQDLRDSAVRAPGRTVRAIHNTLAIMGRMAPQLD